MSLLEEVYGRKTHTIRVDFNEGHCIYPEIAKGLQDLEIGILGISTRVNPMCCKISVFTYLLFIYMYVLDS